MPASGLVTRFSHCSSSSAEQVNDQNHQAYNQEQVDQASADMQTETQKPQIRRTTKTVQSISTSHTRAGISSRPRENLFRADG